MSIVWKIAFRNLKEHRTKTLILGLIIALGVVVLVVGNSLMDTATDGIRRTYTHSYTGDLIVTGLHRSPVTLFGVQDMDGFGAMLPVIPEFDEVQAYIAGHPDVVAVNPQASAAAMVDRGDKRSILFLFGIDPVAYQRMFPDNIELVQGRFLQPGEEGIMLTVEAARQLLLDAEQAIDPDEAVLLTGMNELSGIKIREVPVRGVFRFRQSDPQMDSVALVDINTVRSVAGMKLSAVSEADLSEFEAAIFGDIDESALFGTATDSLFGAELIAEANVVSGPFDDWSLFGAADWSAELSEASDSKAWHFLLIKLRDGASPAAVTADLAAFFADRDIAATTVGWLTGAGPVASLAYGVKSVFNVVILVIAVVGVIIIMNTLVISVTERTTEIGTMRALGAQKRFVRRMVVWETIIASGAFGLVGVMVGCLVLWVLNATGLEAPNMFFEIIFGGKVLHPVPSVRSIGTSLVVVLVVGVVASLYPVSIALRTKPVKAMQG